ncbi:hypothetical protein Vau01_125530 [Virgisporangium aurantiacum]|uniref:Uncharacterized protein n=1 Tax=Virgisporangium aurantiacum TaxID=175570 RepID=A0A8J4EAR2_9ACTN|nr:hypothetical protein Vau01_125530 [Virgisporangium aurantiacum]
MLEPSGCGVSVHPAAEGVAQDRTAVSVADRPVDGPADRRWQRNEDDLATFAAYALYAVAVLLNEIGNAGAADLEDPQPK